MIQNEMNNQLPVTISIKQLSKACRDSILGRFIEHDDKCRLFVKLATNLGFTSNEALYQINTERKYIASILLKEKNANR